jgi:hypothetical protein
MSLATNFSLIDLGQDAASSVDVIGHRSGIEAP